MRECVCVCSVIVYIFLCRITSCWFLIALILHTSSTRSWLTNLQISSNSVEEKASISSMCPHRLCLRVWSNDSSLEKLCHLAVRMELKTKSFIFPQPQNSFTLLQRVRPLSGSGLQRWSSALQLWQIRVDGANLWSCGRTVRLQAARHRPSVHKVCYRILRLPLLQTWAMFSTSVPPSAVLPTFLRMPPLSRLQRVSVAAACATRSRENASAPLRRWNRPAKCARLRLSVIIPCWAATAANALRLESKMSLGPTVTASRDSARE